jgi:opacity protein-like surface antigen
MSATRYKALAAIGVAAALTLSAGTSSAEAQDAYLRTGVFGFDLSRPAVFHDRSCITALILLYGCGASNDGLPTGAYGTFGLSAAFELAAGFSPTPGMRVEAALSIRPTFNFVGDANYEKTLDPQPVQADLFQAALMGWAYFDIGEPSRPLRPFVGVGAGLSLNILSEVRMDYPTLTQPAWTITPPGTRISPAFGFTAGVAHELSEKATLEIAWRYSHYGWAGTDVGPVLIRRGAVFRDDLIIDETRARLATNAVMVSVRWALGR